MKIEERYLKKACHNAMIMQYADMLRSKDYYVEQDKQFSMGASYFQVDLYAEKNKEKRVYEFKVVGNTSEQEKTAHEESIQRFQKYAREVGAIPFVVYVNPPAEKNIQIENLDAVLLSYFKGAVPSELADLSPNTQIEDIEIDELNRVEISSNKTSVVGNAIIYATLDYEPTTDDGTVLTSNFPMTFSATLDGDLSIEDLEYNIDISSWSE